jgi:imidazolonepropionase-like amidohydrolase
MWYQALKEKSMRLGIVAILLLAVGPLWSENIAIRAGNLVDPAAGSITRNVVILVENGRIKSVGPGLAIPAGAQLIDLSSEWITPGLMDAHTHLTLAEVLNAPYESFYLKESTAYRGYRGLRNAQNLLEAGFTSVRDLGADGNYAMEDLRRVIQQGWFDGPTIISAGKIIAPFGGQSTTIPLEQGPFWSFEYIDADTPDEIRKAVRRDIYYGATVIKLVADNSPFFYSLEEIRAAVDEAHRADRAVAVHVYGGQAAQNVIEGGADSVEHGFDLTDAQLQLMKQKGTFLVGTDFPLAQLEIIGTSGGIFPEPAVLAPKIIERLRRAYRIGVKMAFGSDIAIEVPNRTRSELMLDYLSVWRRAGVPPAEILKCMTTNAAELLRINRQRGAIAPGLAADIIAMPGNPPDDIESLRKVNFVMKDGKIVYRPQ